MNAAEITDKLGLHNLRQRKWHTQVNIIISLVIIGSFKVNKLVIILFCQLV